MNLSELKQKPVQELVEIAEGMGADNVGRLRKQDVILPFSRTILQVVRISQVAEY